MKALVRYFLILIILSGCDKPSHNTNKHNEKHQSVYGY